MNTPTATNPAAALAAGFEANEAARRDRVLHQPAAAPLSLLPDVDPATIPPHRSAGELTGLREEQERHAARLDAVLADVEAKLAANADLREQLRIAKNREAKSEAEAELYAILGEMNRLAETADRLAPLHSEQALRLSAQFDEDPQRDAAIRQSWAVRLASATPGDLHLLAMQAVSRRSLALAVAIEQEVARRDLYAEDRGRIVRLCRAVEPPASQRAAGTALAATRRAADDAALKVRELLRGYDGVGRLTQAFRRG